MNRWGLAATAYLLLGALSMWLSDSVRGKSAILLEEPWLPLDAAISAHLFSAFLGLATGAASVLLTRMMVRRLRFAQRLHTDLRPLALSLSPQMMVILAVTSALGEELFFRGLLLPWIGLLPQAVLFGFLHQTGGSSRWVWMVWAFVMGVILGAIYALSGSLVGSLICHALINALNLAFLKSHDPAPNRRGLGGILIQRG
jgi:membrane protease YdiL (CAAX protease family)